MAAVLSRERHPSWHMAPPPWSHGLMDTRDTGTQGQAMTQTRCRLDKTTNVLVSPQFSSASTPR